MPSHLRIVHHAQEDWLRDFESATHRTEIREPSTILVHEPEIEEKMLRDADIGAAIDQRQSLIAGREYNIVPRRKDSPTGELGVAVAEDLLESLEGFPESRKLLSRAFFHGSTYAAIETKPKRCTIGDGVERLWHVPVKLHDRAKWLYRKVIDDPRGPNPVAVWKRWEVYGPQAGQWLTMSVAETRDLVKHVYSDEMSSLGYGKGLRDSLYILWYAKTHTHQETIGAIERFARGLPHLKIDGLRDGGTNKTNPAVMADALKLLNKMMARHSLVTDSRDELEVIHGSGEGHAMMSDFRKELRDSIKTLVLSADLTTGGTDGGGSYALADVQEGSTENLVQFDRESLEESLSTGLLGCLWSKNRANLMELGIANDRPKIDLKQERREDPEVSMRVLQAMHAMGAPIGMEDLYKRAGMPRPGPEDDILATPSGGLPSLGGFDLGGGFGLSDTPQQTPSQADPLVEDHQDTALNGAQVTAAADIIDRVVNSLMPPGTAKRMLISMFNLDPSEASAMVDEAVAFTPVVPAPQQPGAV